MALELKNLDDETRRYMVQEIEADIASKNVYRSKFLTDQGWEKWAAVFLEAARIHDTSWLAEQLRNEGLAVSSRRVVDRRGHSRVVQLQPQTLADSEFNRYYIRGLCLRAIAEGIDKLVTYRAKPVRNPRSAVGNEVSPSALLQDLRANKGETDLDIPSNPNSGISVMLPVE